MKECRTKNFFKVFLSVRRDFQSSRKEKQKNNIVLVFLSLQELIEMTLGFCRENIGKERNCLVGIERLKIISFVNLKVDEDR